MQEQEEKTPYTWAKLKEFCNSLTDGQLSQKVKVIREDDSIDILEASELGEDHYKFDDEEYSVSHSDFDNEYHLDGKYKTLDEALQKEDYRMTPSSAVFLFEDF